MYIAWWYRLKELDWKFAKANETGGRKIKITYIYAGDSLFLVCLVFRYIIIFT
jgi:hypothetical protein